MELLVVLVFALPLLVGLAIVSVKAIEFGMNRDIAPSKVIARWTTIVVLAAATAGIVAWGLYVAIKLSGDTS